MQTHEWEIQQTLLEKKNFTQISSRKTDRVEDMLKEIGSCRAKNSKENHINSTRKAFVHKCKPFITQSLYEEIKQSKANFPSINLFNVCTE